MGAAKKNMGIMLQVFTLFIFCCLPLKGHGITRYKQYVLRQYFQQDILCEPYIVQPHDYLFKLFRQKGNISYHDYPQFIDIFKHVNPDIDNINTILPGQYLLIPLSRVQADTFPEHVDGIVNVPFITLPNRKNSLKQYSNTYEVQKGDSVSVILSKRFQKSHTTDYRKLLALFKQLNPHLADIHQIYPGQTIFVPHADLSYPPWEPSLFHDSGKSIQAVTRQPSVGEKTHLLHRKRASGRNAFQQVADLLGAKFINKGWYVIPHTKPTNDIKINLKLTPLMEFNNGGKVFFYSGQKAEAFSSHQQKARYPDHVKWIKIASRTNPRDIFQALADEVTRNPDDNTMIFNDGSIKIRLHSFLIRGKSSSRTPAPKIAFVLMEQPEQQVPQSICHFLAQKNIRMRNILITPYPSKANAENSDSDVLLHPKYRVNPFHIRGTQNRKDFIQALSTSLKLRFTSDMDISFFYHGHQIKTVSNLISNGKEFEILTDFGSLQGEAIAAVQKSGFRIVSFSQPESFSLMIKKFLQTCDIIYQENPTIAVIPQCIELTFTGFKLQDNCGGDTLICKAPVNEHIVQFLAQQNIRTVLIEPAIP